MNKKWIKLIGNTLPDNAMEYFQKHDIWRSGYAQWRTGTAYYTGGDTPETAKEWCIVTNDGGYYKCFAKYSFWHPSENTGEMLMQCCWTLRHMKKTLESFIETGKTIPDPGYHT